MLLHKEWEGEKETEREITKRQEYCNFTKFQKFYIGSLLNQISLYIYAQNTLKNNWFYKIAATENWFLREPLVVLSIDQGPECMIK